MNDIARQLEQALEAIYPTLVLDIEYGKLDVNAIVYQSVEPFDVTDTFTISPSLARTHIDKASRLQLAGEEVDPNVFNAVLTAMEGGVPVQDPDRPPSASIGDIVDAIHSELQLTDPVIVQIGEARWRVEV